MIKKFIFTFVSIILISFVGFTHASMCTYKNNMPVLIYDNENQSYTEYLKGVFDFYNISYEQIHSIRPENNALHVIIHSSNLDQESLPKYYILCQTQDLTSLTNVEKQLFSQAVAVWDTKWENINKYRSMIHNYFYFPQNYDYADPVILSCLLPIQTLPAYKELLIYSNSKNSDISSHLPTLFAYSVLQAPDGIVEAGVRGGESTLAFSQAMQFCNSYLIGIDIDNNPNKIYAKLMNATFLLMNDVDFPAHYRSKENLKDHNLDIIFIDTSHLYKHTLQEIEGFAPILAQNGILIFHDSYMSPLNGLTTWYLLNGQIYGVPGNVKKNPHRWNNQKGVTRAIKDYFDISFDETKYNNFIFKTDASSWHMIHYPFCNGLTVIKKIS